MFRNFTLSALIAAAGVFSVTAQVTSEPPLVQESSKNVVIYFHADQGNQGLAGQPASAQLYAHTGVITNTSSNPTDWKFAPTWGDNSAKYKLEYVSPNLWKLNIGDIRTYYGITDPSVVVEKLAFVFRNSDNTKEGKTQDGGDIFLQVLPEGMQVLLQSTNTTGNVIQPNNTNITFTLHCTDEASLSLTVNGKTVGTANKATKLSASYDFTETGNYTIVGKAEAGGKTITTTMEYVRPKPSEAKNYPGGKPQMGAVRNSDGSVTFCLAAPHKTGAMIVGNWNNYLSTDNQTMYYQDYQGNRYFWITIPNLEKGKDHIYYYLVDGQKRVGDPYARLVLDPYNDKYISPEVYPNLPAYPYDVATDVPMAVFNDNINDYDWKVKSFRGADRSHLFIYELLFRDFTGTEGKAEGNGTVRAAIEKIPYLKAMGVNAVELLPINEFNGNNSWGYNPNFYFAPDKAYGTPSEYKEFIDACHAQGIAVILDMVFNQTDWLHPWYQLYNVGDNPFYNATAPHAYSVLNDWNQEFPLVRQQFKDALQYWMKEYKVDGFRFDLVKGLGNNSSYANNGDAATNAFNQSRIDNMRDLQQAVLEVNSHAYFINENLAGAPEENAMAEFGQLNWANVNYQGCQYAMGYQSNSGLDRFYAPNDSRTWGSTVSYLESHDEQRLAYEQSKNGPVEVRSNLTNAMHRLGSAAAQMLMAPGSHMVWMFSELGNNENNKDATGGNNTSPKKVNWNMLNTPQRKGLYENYGELANIRNALPYMFDQDVTIALKCSANDWNAGRSIVITKNNKQLILAVNPNISGDPIEVTAPFLTMNDKDFNILSQSYDAQASFSASRGTITVAPNCYAVVGTFDFTGVETITDDADATQLSVSGQNGHLTIHNAPAGIEVYTASGMRVYASDKVKAGEQISLASGVYIVRSGNRAIKIALR